MDTLQNVRSNSEYIAKATGLSSRIAVSYTHLVQRMVQAVEQAWGKVDVLVNNAGIAQQKLFTDLTDADWHNMRCV